MLVRHVVNKAIHDGVRIVLVVPLAVTAPQWHKLVLNSLVGNSDKYIRVRNASRRFRHWSAEDPREMAVFVCDFGRDSGRTGLSRGGA